MLSTTKIRASIIALVASASFAVSSVAPAVSQAQWHTYCVAGHCITHANYTLGGVEPCQAIKGNYDKASGALSEAKTAKEKEEAEGQIHLSEIASFEWGCGVAVHTSPTPVVIAPVGAVQGSPQGSTLPTVLGTKASFSPPPAL